MKTNILILLSFFIFKTCIAQHNYCIKVGLGTAITTPHGSFALKNNIGIIRLTELKYGLHLETGVFFELLNLNNFKTQSTHTSYWSSGPFYTTVNKVAKINQSFLKIPVTINLNRKRIVYGFGVIFTHVLQSSTKQEVIGNYNNPQYPNSEEVLTKSIRYTYEENSNSLKNCRSTNIAPNFSIGINTNKKLRISLSTEYSLYQQFQFTNKISPFNLLSFTLNSYFKL